MKTRTRTHLVPHTIDGTTHMIEQKQPVPALPRDWDAVGIRVASSLVLALTVATVAWSTVSIGHLLGGGIGFAGASIFDIAWIVNVIFEWLGRFDPRKRGFSRRLGWALLVATMGALLWSGLDHGSAALGVVGAAVSLFAKVLWMGVMRHIDRDLSPADAAWVQAEMSKANAQLAVAGVRRQVARAEQRAALELLAAERVRGAVPELPVQVEPVDDTPAPASRPAPARSAREQVAEQLAAMDTAEAIRTAAAARPDLTTTGTVDLLADYGITVDPLQVALALGRHAVRTPVPEQVTRRDTTPDMPQVGGLSKADAIVAMSRALGPDASPADIAHHLAGHGVGVDTAYVRTALHRATKRQRRAGRKADAAQGAGGYL